MAAHTLKQAPGVLVGFAPWRLSVSAKNDSVLLGAPTLLLKVSEPLLLTNLTGRGKPVSLTRAA